MNHKHSSSLWLASALASVLAGSALAGPVYTYSTFTVGGALATSSIVTGINNAGDVTGYYFDASSHANGFLLKADGTLSPIAPGNTFHNVEAFGVNNSDTVSGWNDYLYNGVNSTYEGFVKPLGGNAVYVGGTSSPYRVYGYGLNDSGVMVGYYNTAASGSFSYTYNGTAVTTLNDPGTPGDTFAFGINNSGQIVGYYLIGGVQHGFLRNTDGTYVNIDDPLAGHGTDPQAINSQGDIAGYYLDSINKVHGFVYLASDHSFETIDLGAGRNYVYGINDSDQISGSFQQSGVSTYTDFIGSAAPTGATPEPASWLLLAGGMALMAVNKFSQRR